MELVTILSIIATAAATVAIAFYTRKTHSLMEAVRQKDSEHQQQIKDLFQAIVISNLLVSDTASPGSSRIDERINGFKKLYPGLTQIFK
jgi:hypothetical protein